MSANAKRAAGAGEPITLRPETEQAIAEVLTHYPVAEAALLPALHLVQDDLGWLPVGAMDWVAERLAYYGTDAGGFLPKPFNVWELIGRLEKLLED